MSLPLWGIGLAVFGLAMISLIEAALISMDPVRLRQLIDDGNRAAMLIARMVARPEELLAGLVVAINALVLLAANLTTTIWHGAFWPNLLVLLILLVIGEIIPKTISVHFVESIALRTARFAWLINLLLRPIIVVLAAISTALLRLLTVTHILPGRVHAVPTAFSHEDIKQLLTIGEIGGEVEASEREMISGVIEFAETSAGEIMVPRTEVVILPDDAILEDALRRFLDSGHSRMPVYRDNADNIIGVLYIKDVLIRLKTARDAGEALPAIADMLRPAYFVPESKKSDELLRELQRKRVHLAIVVDEYGGTAGIITIEDILEEIVGDIIDEYDKDRQDVVCLPDGTAILNGRAGLEQVHETLDMPLPDTKAETISGLVTEILGHIPELGDQVIINGVEFTVQEVKHNRAERLRAVILPDEATQ